MSEDQTKPRELLRNDRSRCSWCRESLPNDGVVKVTRTKERVYNDRGEVLGLEGDTYLLWFHPTCFDDYKGPTLKERIGSVMCTYCQNWKMKAKSKMATGLYCICQCHPVLGRQVIRECKILDVKEMEEGLAKRAADKAQRERLIREGKRVPEKRPKIVDKPTGQQWSFPTPPKEETPDGQ